MTGLTKVKGVGRILFRQFFCSGGFSFLERAYGSFLRAFFFGDDII